MSGERSISVVHVSPSLDESYGGPATSVPSLAAALRAEGIAGSLVSVDTSAAANHLIEVTGLRWRRARPAQARLGYFSSELIRRLDEAVAETRAEIIHVHSFWGWPVLAADIVARRQGAALVVSPRSEFYPASVKRSGTLKRLFLALVGRAVLGRVAFVHATEPGEAEATRVLGHGGRIVVAPNGVDASIGDDPLERLEALAALDLAPTTGRRALFLSRLHQRKGLETLFQAWAARDLGARGWRLMVAGDAAEPAYNVRLRRLAIDLGIADDIDWLGHVDAARRRAAFFAADLFVLPSQFENFGLSIAEALACGLPVVTTTATPWPGLPAEGAGWLVAPQDVEALGRALVEADARGAQGLQAMAPAARAAVRRLGWAQAAQALATAYRDIGHRTSARTQRCRETALDVSAAEAPQ